MNLRSHPAVRTAAVLATAALLAGCSGDTIAERLAEEAIGRAGGGDVDIDIDTGSVSFDNDDGSFTIGWQDLPEDMPDEFPLPNGIAVTGSMSQTDDDGTGIGVQATTEESFGDTVAFFGTELEASGWTVTETNTMDMGGMKTQMWGIEGYGFAGQVSVSQIGEDGDDDMFVAVSINLRSLEEE